MEKKKLAKAVSSGSATAIGSLLFGTSLFMHRSETHQSVKLNPVLRHAARFTVWAGGGMKPREWVGVHLKHHDNTDLPGDPHSPVQNGRFGVLKVLFGNVPMYRKAAKQIQAEQAWPERLNPDQLDRKIYDKGLLGQAALFGILTKINGNNPIYGGVALLTHDVIMFGAGGVVNGLGHSGSGNIVKAMVNGPLPDEAGSYARNLNPATTFATMGEGRHANHHQDPNNWQIGNNLKEDPTAALIAALQAAKLVDTA